MQTHTKKTLQIYFQHAWKYKLRFLGIVLFACLGIGFDIARPFVYKNLIDALTINTTEFRWVVFLLFLWSLCATLRIFSWRTVGFLTNYFQPKVMSDLLATCFEKIHLHSYNFFSSNFVGSLVTKVKRYERGFETITDLIVQNIGRTIITCTVIFIILFRFNTSFGLAMIAWAVIYLIVVALFVKFRIKYHILKAEAETKVTGQLADTITNALNVKLFSAFNKEKNRFDKIVGEHQSIRILTWNADNWLQLFQGISMVIVEFWVLYSSLRLWQAGSLSIGEFVFVQAYMGRVFDFLWELSSQLRKFYEALADSSEMTEILLTPIDVDDKPNAKQLTVTDAKIEFKDITFHYYKDKDVFRNFNLTIEPKQKIALVGPSGGGKTTVTKLLFRFFEPIKGQVLIDGQDIGEVTQNSLRGGLSLVPQDPILFHRTLFENIRYGKPNATKEEVYAAAKAARAHEFITSFPQGYDTFVGERGVKLSGGERQRVAIARAILKNAPILVLDEATSSLDSESEAMIQDALEELMRNKTVIVIAHRMSTIMKMDRIIVIEKGKIIEDGKHSELLKAKKGTYQRLWHIQAGGFSAER